MGHGYPSRRWKASATRGDVYVDLANDPGLAGQPKRWSTWFVLDGGDSHAQAPCLFTTTRVGLGLKWFGNSAPDCHASLAAVRVR